jgi:hypothetical protein
MFNVYPFFFSPPSEDFTAISWKIVRNFLNEQIHGIPMDVASFYFTEFKVQIDI